ncbi:hypothetical protein [Lactococcus lactis]|uniref:hypothetical protein n=1 Tax=Lactococcus lactis TaxID=1358 RepID=UPI00034AED78|nr:hypothetical protein [Lactococcus lactis]QOK49290.1 hypothetical protein HZ322_06565 [Lactococcus lactis]
MSDEIQGWRDIIQQNGKRKQPQLTIPKSIADLLDEELNPLERESMIETFVLGVNYLVLSVIFELNKLNSTQLNYITRNND